MFDSRESFRHALGSSKMAVVGALVWMAWIAIERPTPDDIRWPHALLLFSPLVLVPLALGLLVRRMDNLALPWNVTRFMQLPSAILLAVSYHLQSGNVAALLAFPWFLTTLLIALGGALQIWRGAWRSMPELCIAMGLVNIAVGGGWSLAYRLGFRPLNFEEVIVLLTAAHFHYAGVLLPIVTGLAARRLPGLVSRITCALVVVAVPLVAVGITASQKNAGPILECIAALSMSIGGLLATWLHWRLAFSRSETMTARTLWALFATCLLFGMALSASYGLREYNPTLRNQLPLARMWLLHGSANVVGLTLAILGWRSALARRAVVS